MPTPPHDTSGRLQRASRPVPFDVRGDLWAAVQEGVIFSEDLNERMQFDPPPPARRAAPATPPPLPFERQLRPVLPPPPPSAPPAAARRAPLADVSLNVLRTEVKALEDENAALKKFVTLQDNVILGLCELHVHQHQVRNDGAP